MVWHVVLLAILKLGELDERHKGNNRHPEVLKSLCYNIQDRHLLEILLNYISF